MAKATLINSAGNKVVVDSGSQEAKNYFGQGYQLMGSSGKYIAPVAPTPTPAPAQNTGGQKATLINQSGNKVVVESGSQQAQQYFGEGYKLMTPDNVDQFINQNQEQDFNQKENETVGSPAVSSATKAIEELRGVIAPKAEAPAAPKLEETYNTLRETYGISDLESSMNELKQQEEAIVSETRDRMDYAESKPVALGVISGRQSEVSRQADKRLTEIRRQQAYISDQLKTKYGIIENIMNLRQKDYENASASYDKEFATNISLLNTVRQLEQDQKTEEDTKKDNARADYTIFVNAIKDGNVDVNNLSAAQKATLNKLEVQAGLPVGTYEMLMPKTQNADLKSLGTANNSSGGQSAYFMAIDKTTGQPTIISLPLPGSVSTKGGGGSDDEEEKEIKQFRTDAADLIQKLDNGDITWGTAYDSLKVKYPLASSAAIDQALGGGYNENKKEYYGRAAQ